jgi:hypothetical protein
VIGGRMEVRLKELIAEVIIEKGGVVDRDADHG